MTTTATTRRYRCTRPDAYPPGTPGHDNASARSGYYVTAASVEEAERLMRERLKLDDNERLDIVWAREARDPW